MLNDQKNPPPQAVGPPSGLERKLRDAQGPVELAPISNVPITVKLTDKSDTVYRTIGQLAGINVLFDPDYTARPIKVELNGVTLEEALESPRSNRRHSGGRSHPTRFSSPPTLPPNARSSNRAS